MLDPRLDQTELDRLSSLDVDWRNAFAGLVDAGKRRGAYPAAAAAAANLPTLRQLGSAVVESPAEPVRRTPAHRAEQITEARMGERLELLAEESGWWLVACEDGYVGWLRAWSSRSVSDAQWQHWREARLGLFGRPTGWLRPVGDEADVGPAGPLQLGVPLLRSTGPSDPGHVRVELVDGRQGQLPAQDLVTAPPRGTAGEAVAWARHLVGAGYRWGGRTALGLDCSGLVQLVCALAGFDLPRDSGQQAGCGRELSLDPQDWRRGDLLFFDDPVDHVGLVDDGHLLHARGRVRRDRFDELPELMALRVAARRLSSAEYTRRATLWLRTPLSS